MKKRVALLLVLTLLLSMLPTVALATEKETPVEKNSGLMENAEENLDSMTTEPRESAPEAEQSDEPESSKSAALDFTEDLNAQPESVGEEMENVSAEDGLEQVVSAQDETLAQEPDLAGEDVVASGTCGDQGDNLTWTLDSVGTLTISGSGDMQNYESYGNSSNLWAPWQPYRDEIQCVVIEDGVTSIGSYAFDTCAE